MTGKYPDAIQCKYAIFFLMSIDDANLGVSYRILANRDHEVNFWNGTIHSTTGFLGSDCDGKTIDSLYTEGKAFHFKSVFSVDCPDIHTRNTVVSYSPFVSPSEYFTLIGNPPSGSEFSLNSIANVTATISYFNGMEDSCTFRVIVDTISPTLDCPDIYSS